MVAYNFQAQFVPAIQSGQKRHTIRRVGKRRHARVGERLQLYTGMRTRSCIRIVEPDPTCIAVAPIQIHIGDELIAAVVVGDTPLRSRRELEAFSRLDGFKNLAAMSAFWLAFHGSGTFFGFLIGWEPNL